MRLLSNWKVTEDTPIGKEGSNQFSSPSQNTQLNYIYGLVSAEGVLHQLKELRMLTCTSQYYGAV